MYSFQVCYVPLWAVVISDVLPVIKSQSPLLCEKETFFPQQEYSMYVYIQMCGKDTKVCCENQDLKYLIDICR